MKVRSLMLAVLANLIGTSVLSCAHAALSAEPQRLEHMDYVKARRIILGYGWRPVSLPCVQPDRDVCAQFPEISYCSGVGPGYCGMVFLRDDRCLYVTTSGGQPQRLEHGDTHVESVTFRRGPCSKE